MSVNSCTFDTNSRKNSSVVLMHVHRGKSTMLLNSFDKNTTKCCHMYNRCKYAGCNIAIYPLTVLRTIYQSCSPRSPPNAASSADTLAKNVPKSKGWQC